ncbi:MAG TPA: glycosyltransferase, partial [Pseudonocardiaceae bacterium]|nr:glycosyltransferase [Pseudonocardiaceae bacterium]
MIIAFDVPFLGIAKLLPTELRARLILVPRSSALIHQPSDRERVEWERDSMLAGLNDGTRIGVISRFMGLHLRRDYGVASTSLVHIADGLANDDWTRLSIPWKPDPSMAKLPVEFVLTLGRAEPYKGFDDLLTAYSRLNHSGVDAPPLVIAATTETRHNQHQQHLADRIVRLNVNAVMLHEFTPAVAGILRHPGVRAVVVPSRAEPFGRIPMEAFVAGAGPVITTTAHGLASQMIDRSIGFSCPPRAPEELAEALAAALAMDAVDRFRMIRRARQLALREFDHPAAVREMLAQLAPWLELPNPADRLRLLASTASPSSPESTVPRPFVKVPIGPQARHWNTVRPQRRVLVVTHHITSLVRLLDVLPVFDSDPRIQLVFSCNGSDPFTHGLDQYLDNLGVVTIPWQQAITTEFDLVVAANHGGLTEVTGPLVILEHGVGYSKISPGDRRPETGDRRPETGDRRPETGDRRPETGDRRPETGDRRP